MTQRMRVDFSDILASADVPEHLRPLCDGSFEEVGQYGGVKNIFSVLRAALVRQWRSTAAVEKRLDAVEAETRRLSALVEAVDRRRPGFGLEAGGVDGRLRALERRMHAVRIMVERLNVRTARRQGPPISTEGNER